MITKKQLKTSLDNIGMASATQLLRMSSVWTDEADSFKMSVSEWILMTLGDKPKEVSAMSPLAQEMKKALEAGYKGERTYSPEDTVIRMKAMIKRNEREEDLTHRGKIDWLAMLRDKISEWEVTQEE